MGPTYSLTICGLTQVRLATRLQVLQLPADTSSLASATTIESGAYEPLIQVCIRPSDGSFTVRDALKHWRYTEVTCIGPAARLRPFSVEQRPTAED